MKTLKCGGYILWILISIYGFSYIASHLYVSGIGGIPTLIVLFGCFVFSVVFALFYMTELWFLSTHREPYAFIRFITGLEYFSPDYESWYWNYVIPCWVIIVLFCILFIGIYHE